MHVFQRSIARTPSSNICGRRNLLRSPRVPSCPPGYRLPWHHRAVEGDRKNRDREVTECVSGRSRLFAWSAPYTVNSNERKPAHLALEVAVAKKVKDHFDSFVVVKEANVNG
jgi:hypothetical protein